MTKRRPRPLSTFLRIYLYSKFATAHMKVHAGHVRFLLLFNMWAGLLARLVYNYLNILYPFLELQGLNLNNRRHSISFFAAAI